MNVFDNIKGVAHVVCESIRLTSTISGHIYDLKCNKREILEYT